MTVTIKNARQVDDLTSHKLEFVAVNMYDTTEHGVDVEAYIPGQFFLNNPHRFTGITLWNN